MTVTTENLINESLAKTVDSEIQKLATLFKEQQAAENRREAVALAQPRRQRTLNKFLARQ